MTTKRQCNRSHLIFARGYMDAQIGIASETARQTLNAHPDYSASDVTVYLNGAEDGAHSDTFRLALPCGLCGK